jgi:uncharacterized membrane protein
VGASERTPATTGAGAQMAEFSNSPLAQLIWLSAVLGALVVVGVYVIGKVRAGIAAKESPASEWLTKFEELHARGELSDEEYRTIKAVLAERLQRELNSTDETA